MFTTVFGSSGTDFAEKISDFTTQRKALAASKSHNSWHIRRAIENFDKEMLDRLVERGADIVSAFYIADQFSQNEEYAMLNTAKNIIHLAANNLSVEVFAKAMQAGFRLEEIRRYPFLASNLLRYHSPQAGAEIIREEDKDDF
jgi:GTP-binding protein EngB required for normal cell division